jgi:predicted Zn-dependent protease
MINVKKIPFISALALLPLMFAAPDAVRAAEPPAPVDSSAEGVHVPSLIAQSNGMERRFLYQNLIVDERDLTDYLSDILEKLALPEERIRYNLRVRVLRSNVFNAFAAPNGTVFICTGLLSRVADESQAAAVLAHELAHIVLDHTEKNMAALKRQAREVHIDQSRRNPEALILSDGIAGSVIGDAQRSAIAGYGDRIEHEADSVAVVRMAAAGYRPPADFRKFIESIRDGVQEAGLDKRKSQARSAAVDGAGAGEDDIDRGYFNVKLGGIIMYEAVMNHAAGRPELVEPLLDRLLAVDSCDVAALIKRGDMERQLAPRSVAAIEWYDKALTCSPGNPAALRAMGFAYHSLGRTREACRYLRGYCKMAGDAADIKMARELLRRCDERRAAK